MNVLLKALKGRNILLTGATGYFGLPIAKEIILSGANLLITGRNEESLSAVINQMPREFRGSCYQFVADLSKAEDVIQLCVNISKNFSAIHGIVNNAYCGRVGNIELIDPEDFVLACQLNIITPFLLVRELSPNLICGAVEFDGGASVVNISSMYGTVSPDPRIYHDAAGNNPAHYGASKAGLTQLTRYLACHLGPHGIRVNSISPGPFPRAGKGAQAEQFIRKLEAKVPMARIGQPEEIAGPVVFLLSAAASYINGANIPVDGGWTAW